MLTLSEMMKANIDQLANLIDYIDTAWDNVSIENQFPRVYDKGFICPQELNVEVSPGIVAQLPLNSNYFNLGGYIKLFLSGARLNLEQRRAEYWAQVDRETNGPPEFS